ncbi:glucosamine---fructose-6-phosphate aminotransferase (isomerizing) [Anaerolineae bacterium]|nr:SIS domain-containing protein [Anaerolinea sp.]CAG0982334.1 glucosamine---fructose-6-phosphate aminotransferase (isomerizing) [Anaerolineae bacterium]
MTYHIEREIAEQPEALRRLVHEGMPKAEQIAAAIRAFDPAFVLIAARGTSDNAGRYAQYLWGVHIRLSVGLATPSVHTLYEAAPNLSRALVIGISQSGKAEDVRRVLDDARKQGALTVSITNDPDSPLATGAHHHLPLMVGPEVSVAATKTYTGQLAAMALIAAALEQTGELRQGLLKLPEYVAETLRLSEDIPHWCERYRYMERFVTTGRGYNYATAFEISLKIKELCYLAGAEYSEADFRHGPIAMVAKGFPVITIAPEGKTLPNMVSLLEKLKERGAENIVISNNAEAAALGEKVMRLPAGIPEWLSPLVAVIPGQIFAYRLALAKGHSVDQPEGLRKVTITQ